MCEEFKFLFCVDIVLEVFYRMFNNELFVFTVFIFWRKDIVDKRVKID